MDAYRIPGQVEIDDVAAEALRDARRLRLEERLRFIDALIGSRERTKVAGGVSTSAAFGVPFAAIGWLLWILQADDHPLNAQWLIGLAFLAVGLLVTWTWQAAFRVARFITRRSLARLG